MINTRISEEAVALACVVYLGSATAEEVELIYDKMYNALYAVDKFAELHLVLEPDVGDTIVVVSTYDGLGDLDKVTWDGSYWTSGDTNFETNDLEKIYVNNNLYKRVERNISIFEKDYENED